MTRHVCVHGHFYQPPRENPWLESVQLQEGAYPYHDWNERITDECYAQNAASRVLDEDGRIAHIVNNYGRISFNMGPTLLAWMEDAAPEVHDAIVAGDRESIERFGRGSAMAQAYGHLIMPLANARDRRTQVAWGVADFVHRFGRRPEGMWLPETAVDTDSLEALAEHDIAFTVLEPGQASRVRPLRGGSGDRAWRDVSGGRVDTTQPYLVRLPSGREITVFFYDAAVSRAVAFEGLLADGAAFAKRLAGALPVGEAGLINIATDGESYGHHHRHGDMALAFALHELDHRDDVELTNYATYLAANPPAAEVEIVEETSWSCAHGVERWRADCGCADGGHPDWDQAWRAPLRAALDDLRDELAPRYEDAAGQLLRDPWAARDAYISVILDRSDESRSRFLADHALGDPGHAERVRIWRLLELQRHAMLMFTSCGWFFDDLGRIEVTQVLRYAGRAVELGRQALDVDVEGPFLGGLADARSNDPAVGDGRAAYERSISTSFVDLDGAAAHYVVSSLFEPYGHRARIHCYEVDDPDRRELDAAGARLAAGRIDVRSTVTGERIEREYAVVHLGDHNLEARLREVEQDGSLDEDREALAEPFSLADLPETLRRLDDVFGVERFTLQSLFRDEQRLVLRTILDASIAESRATMGELYAARAPLMRYLNEIGARVPRPFLLAAEVAVNDALREAVGDISVDPARVDALLADAETWGLRLDTEGLALRLSETIGRLTELAADALPEPTLFEHFGEAQVRFFTQAAAVVELADRLPFEVDLWRAQNLFHDTVLRIYPDLRARADAGDEVASTWAESLHELGDALSVAIDAVVQDGRGRS